MELGVRSITGALDAGRQLSSGTQFGSLGARPNEESASTLSKRSIRFGSSVVIEGSFQTFLAEQTARQAAADAATQSPAASHQATSATTEAQRTSETVHILQRGETIWELARERYHVDPDALVRYNTINSPAKLRAGTKIRIPGGHVQTTDTNSQEVVAGWYGAYHQGRFMANGRRFNMHAATIAHRNMPIGTKVELENPQTGEKAKAVVTDRGPYHQGRDVDLSFGLAKRLSLTKQGVGNLKMRVL